MYHRSEKAQQHLVGLGQPFRQYFPARAAPNDTSAVAAANAEVSGSTGLCELVSSQNA